MPPIPKYVRQGTKGPPASQSVSLALKPLRPDQWEIAIHPARKKVIAAGRRYGKTVLAGSVCLASAFRGSKTAWLAPTFRMTRPLWNEALRAVNPLTPTGAVHISQAEKTITFPATGGSLSVYSLDNPSSIRGQWFDLVVIDEAARIPESAWYEDVEPTLADRNGQAFLVSTPRGKNWFWEVFTRGQEDGVEYASFQAPTSANPMPTIRQAFELAKLRTPDQAFRQEWMGEFVDDSLVLFTPEYLERRFNPTIPVPLHQIYATFISWDTALKDKNDNAYSAAIVGQLMCDYRLRIVNVYRDRLSFPALIDQIQSLAQRYREQKLYGVVIEDRSSGVSAIQTIQATSESWLASKLIAFMPTTPKPQRAAQAGVWCLNGSVQLPEPSLLPNGQTPVPWLYAFEQELYKASPKAAYMDQVDAFAQMVLLLQPYLEAGLKWRKKRFGSEFAPIDPSRRN